MDNKQNLLEIKVQKLEQLSSSLLQRICELEDAQEHLTDQINKLNKKNQQLEKEIEQLKNKKQDEIEESWLFFCDTNKTLDQVQKKLEIESNFIKEFDLWQNENQMWICLAEFLEPTKQINGQNSLQLKKIVRESFKQHINDEILIFVKNVSKNKLNLLIDLCQMITEIWNEIELDDECEGRILLVLSSNENLNKLELQQGDQQKVILQIEQLW